MNQREFQQIVQMYTSKLYRFVYRSVKEEAWAEDIVQDSFIKLWENSPKIDQAKIKSWLFTTAYRQMLNELQKKGKWEVEMPLNYDMEISSESNNWELKEQLEKTMEYLPPIQKSILLLKDLEGYEYKEIGEILSVTESQVKVYLFRARQKMKELLTKAGISA